MKPWRRKKSGSVSSAAVGCGADEHAAERDVAGRDRLGERREVGRDAVVVGGEPTAGAAEAGDDLVEDQVCAVLVAQLAQRLQVAIRRRVHAAGALHRLGDDGRDLVAALAHQRGDGLDVVGRHLHDFVDERAEVLLVGRRCPARWCRRRRRRGSRGCG